jgi:Tfp pilus assembly protein PilV
MLRTLRKNGFASVLEVIITSIIFMLAAFGILTTVSMLRPAGQESYREVEASYHAKNMMDYLRDQVNATTWADNTGPLATGVAHSQTIGDYTVNWYLTEVNPGEYPAGLAPRKLMMNVYYPD